MCCRHRFGRASSLGGKTRGQHNTITWGWRSESVSRGRAPITTFAAWQSWICYIKTRNSHQTNGICDLYKRMCREHLPGHLCFHFSPIGRRSFLNQNTENRFADVEMCFCRYLANLPLVAESRCDVKSTSDATKLAYSGRQGAHLQHI